MNLGKSMGIGMLGAFLHMGVDIDKIDWNNSTLYITVPKESYDYGLGKIDSPKSLAESIKKYFIDMNIIKDCKCKYRTRDVLWTKEMGEANFKNNIHGLMELL